MFLQQFVCSWLLALNSFNFLCRSLLQIHIFTKMRSREILATSLQSCTRGVVGCCHHNIWNFLLNLPHLQFFFLPNPMCCSFPFHPLKSSTTFVIKLNHSSFRYFMWAEEERINCIFSLLLRSPLLCTLTTYFLILIAFLLAIIFLLPCWISKVLLALRRMKS